MKIRGATITTPIARSAVADDKTISRKPWSSKNTIDTLCPTFTESGAAVTCEPVEGYPLDVVSHIKAVQEGSGEPSPNGWGNNAFSNSWITSTDPFTVNYSPEEDYIGIELQFKISSSVVPSSISVLYSGTDLLAVVYNSSDVVFTIERHDNVHIVVNWDGGTPADCSDKDKAVCTLCTQVQGNIRPITGWDGVTLVRNGKNLFDISKVKGSINNGDGTLTVKKRGTITNSPRLLRTYAPALRVGKTYKMSANCTHTGNFIYLSGHNKSWRFGDSLVMTEKILNSEVLWYNSTEDGDSTPNIISNIQIEEGKVATAYEPYSSEEITIDFGQTVYGGSYDWQSGVLAITHGYIDSYAGEEIPDGWTSSTGELSQGAQVVYSLAEPITVQLAPQKILALPGVNTLTSNTGDTSVIGKADPSTVIEKLTNAIIALGGNI